MAFNTLKRIALSNQVQHSMWGWVARNLIRKTKGSIGYSTRFLVDSFALPRPHYVYCMYHAAILAKSLGHSRISAIEFGVAGGNGLKYMTEFAKDIFASTGITVECYGFDTGKGMPEPEGPLDLPYWFQSGQYAMNQGALVPEGLLDRVVIGNVSDTVKGFVAERNPAPIGAVFGDLDYWSSTKESLKLLESAAQHPQNFLPRLFMYFDDIIGTEIEMYGPFNGQLAAVSEFNDRSTDMKIHLNQNLLHMLHFKQRYQIYYAHLFGHPRYNDFVGTEGQDEMEKKLKYRNVMK
jgi:hypothetical protein